MNCKKTIACLLVLLIAIALSGCFKNEKKHTEPQVSLQSADGSKAITLKSAVKLKRVELKLFASETAYFEPTEEGFWVNCKFNNLTEYWYEIFQDGYLFYTVKKESSVSLRETGYYNFVAHMRSKDTVLGNMHCAIKEGLPPQ